MPDISAIILAKNEEDMIGDCLSSLSFCDEIVVVDNGSTDKTPHVAKKHNARVYYYVSDDFSELRNYGAKVAQGKWLFYIDADERATPSLGREIGRVSRSSEGFAAFRVKRQNFYLGNHPWPKIEKLERVFRKTKLEGWHGKVHESPKVDGKIGQLQHPMFHYTHRDLTSMVDKTIQWSKTEAELRFAADHPDMKWWRFPRVMLSAFFDSYIGQGGWKAGTTGLIESMYQAFSMFITYARLWELQQKKK